MAFPWTKFQDFYLRLGFLKALAACLDADRRSALNQAIERKLARPLFEPARKHQELWRAVASHYPDSRNADPKKFTTVAEALLVAGDSSSLLFAITPDTSYKVLDWGHDVHLVGRGNQISERALVLRALMDTSAADKFLAGDVTAWNPFILTTEEKLFFLYHLAEIDELTLRIIETLARRNTNEPLEAGDAARLMCRGFFDVLTHSQPSLLPRETPMYRIALDLACVIADELALTDFAAICGTSGGVRKIGRTAKRAPLTRVAHTERRTTKSADHQTIPRFEQLTDLGFLAKAELPSASATAETIQQRKRWRYIPTAVCTRWAPRTVSNQSTFLLQGFAHTAVRAYDLGSPSDVIDELATAKYLWRAYETIHRPVGHTPFDSVALLAMIFAAVDGLAIEISAFHALMLRLKQQGLLPQHAFFASGNEIDKMFVLLKPGFLQALEAHSNIAGKAPK
jgi:hypothetical protein